MQYNKFSGIIPGISAKLTKVSYTVNLHDTQVSKISNISKSLKEPIPLIKTETG